jgi:hypothetical protein
MRLRPNLGLEIRIPRDKILDLDRLREQGARPAGEFPWLLILGGSNSVPGCQTSSIP